MKKPRYIKSCTDKLNIFASAKTETLIVAYIFN